MKLLGLGRSAQRRISRLNSKVAHPQNTTLDFFGYLTDWWTCIGYLKKVVEKLKEGGADEARVKEFQKKVQNYYTSKIAPNFKDYDFYAGESMDPEGMYAGSPLSSDNAALTRC